MNNLNSIQKNIFKEISETKIYLYCTPKCGGSSLLDTLNQKYKKYPRSLGPKPESLK